MQLECEVKKISKHMRSRFGAAASAMGVVMEYQYFLKYFEEAAKSFNGKGIEYPQEFFDYLQMLQAHHPYDFSDRIAVTLPEPRIKWY